MTTSTATIQRYRNSLSTTTYMSSLPVPRIRDILSQLLPDGDLTLLHVREIQTSRLRRLYNLNLSNGSQLLLVYTPSLAIRLLRHEQSSLRSEVTLLYFLGDYLRSHPQSKSTYLARTPSPGPSSAPQAKHEFPVFGHGLTLNQIVPRILTHSDTTQATLPFTIFDRTPAGAPLSSMSDLSVSEKQDVDRQLGAMMRNISHIVAPTERFGPISRVYPHINRLSPPPSTYPTPGSPQNAGSQFWSSAFQNMLERILRDAEDMSVLLPYGDIRTNFARFAVLLDHVTTPRLFILDAGQDDNLVVARGAEIRSNSKTPVTAPAKVQITGLRDWSQGIFGDPLMATCFDNPSKEFMAGWQSVEGEDEDDGSLDDLPNAYGARERLLLYQTYHAIVNIVIEYYRPRSDSSFRELEARKQLTTALRTLDAIELKPDTSDEEDRADGRSETTKRSRSPSAALTDKDDIKRAKFKDEEDDSDSSDESESESEDDEDNERADEKPRLHTSTRIIAPCKVSPARA